MSNTEDYYRSQEYREFLFPDPEVRENTYRTEEFKAFLDKTINHYNSSEVFLNREMERNLMALEDLRGDLFPDEVGEVEDI